MLESQTHCNSGSIFCDPTVRISVFMMKCIKFCGQSLAFGYLVLKLYGIYNKQNGESIHAIVCITGIEDAFNGLWAIKATLPARLDEVVGFLSIFCGYHNQISTLRFNLKAFILSKALIALFTAAQQNWFHTSGRLLVPIWSTDVMLFFHHTIYARSFTTFF